jgi:uncharacterized protein GlcG (DUF336 family)
MSAHTFKRSSISGTTALQLAAAACEKAEELGMGITVVIVDESGRVKLSYRMDNAALMSLNQAGRKAVTAVGLGLSTGTAWHDFIKDDPILSQGVNHIEEFTLLGGGLPIVIDGAMVGAIGVSGGHYSQDEACAKAALATLGSD